MMFPHAVIFDLGGTLVHSPGGNEDMSRRWMLSYHYLAKTLPESYAASLMQSMIE